MKRILRALGYVSKKEVILTLDKMVKEYQEKVPTPVVKSINELDRLSPSDRSWWFTQRDRWDEIAKAIEILKKLI